MKRLYKSEKPENIEKVIDLFLNTNENTYPAISKKTGLKESTVSKIIDNYVTKNFKPR